VARLGGDEFVALLADAGPAMREVIINRIDRGLETHNQTAALPAPLSMSVGISFFDPDQPTSIAALMTTADQLMYADKRERRARRPEPQGHAMVS